jgi:hypothetical protein
LTGILAYKTQAVEVLTRFAVEMPWKMLASEYSLMKRDDPSTSAGEKR